MIDDEFVTLISLCSVGCAVFFMIDNVINYKFKVVYFVLFLHC